MTPLRIVLILILGMTPLVLQADDEGKKVAPLFASNDVLAITITAPFSEIMEDRESDEEFPATLTYTDAEEGEVTVDLELRTRGRYRRQSRTCTFAPLRLNFKKSTVKGTVFAKSDKLKLVTHCRDKSSRHQQSLITEYIAYRAFNVVTDISFRVRPLLVRYVDSGGKDKDREAFAFVIEHRDQLGKRIGLSTNETEKTSVEALDGPHTNLGSMFQYLIGNTDFSPIRGAKGEPCCHNNMLFGDTQGEILAIPYDFDMSGLVNAPYATPNPRFKLRNVRQRLYRGRCANKEHINGSTETFIRHKAEIYALLDEHSDLSRKTRAITVQYLDQFYAILENDRRRTSQLTDKCI